MKKLLLFVLFCILSISAHAQWKWYNPVQADSLVVQNQGFTNEIGRTYSRLPDRAKGIVREPVWELSRNSAGLAIHFYSNASQIKVRYTVAGALNMPHMPSTGVSGIDLYQINSDGQAGFCFGNYSFGDTIHYTYHITERSPYHARGFEYRLFLPLYNSVKWMEIGIPDSCELAFIPISREKPIVLYGTSIAQGACASRPAMAWGNILQRSLEYPLINLGFSGNGRLEKEVLELVVEQDARLFILDCLPNLTNKTEVEITDLLIAAVKQIRQKRKAPIVLVEHAGYSNALTDSSMYTSYSHSNKGSRKAYDILLSENIPDIYYVSHEDLNFPADGWVDYVHPSDLGMVRQASVLSKKIREILHIPTGAASTTRPVVQRREPNSYDWLARHYSILASIKNNPPKAVIIGNSITHYWGGKPIASKSNGAKSWNAIMEPVGFLNLGCGWDRIENILWRVYHGELEGYQAEKVVLLAGTNNLGCNKDEEIMEGIGMLISAIQIRQPQASLQVVGILPRRNLEKRIKKLNQKIQKLTEEKGGIFCNAGVTLLKQEDKIDESFFVGDGLHPNEKGYHLIAKEIIR